MARPRMPRDQEGNIIRENTPSVVPVSEKYILTLFVGKDMYNVEGDTLLSAFEKLSPNTYGKGLARIVVEYQNKKTEVPIKIVPTKLERIFNNRWEMELFCKRLKTLV